MAFDHGHPMKVTFVNVSIALTDANDNAPSCAERVRKVWVHRVSSFFVQLTAITWTFLFN